MECRVGCGACCIAASVSSSIPGMPGGKPAGVRCVQLTSDNRCNLYGKPERPAVCSGFQASSEMCGGSFHEAIKYIEWLEQVTSSGIAPDQSK
jgi:Fe-S-cluster containining protein